MGGNLQFKDISFEAFLSDALPGLKCLYGVFSCLGQTLVTIPYIRNRIKCVHFTVYKQYYRAAYLPDFCHDITRFIDF